MLGLHRIHLRQPHLLVSASLPDTILSRIVECFADALNEFAADEAGPALPGKPGDQSLAARDGAGEIVVSGVNRRRGAMHEHAVPRQQRINQLRRAATAQAREAPAAGFVKEAIDDVLGVLRPGSACSTRPMPPAFP